MKSIPANLAPETRQLDLQEAPNKQIVGNIFFAKNAPPWRPKTTFGPIWGQFGIEIRNTFRQTLSRNWTKIQPSVDLKQSGADVFPIAG